MTEFREVIQELIELFDTLTPVEEAKIHAVATNNIVAVEDCMNREQAAILRLKGLDRKREELQSKLGFEGKSFQEILQSVTGEDRRQLAPLFEGLGAKISHFQDVNEDANILLKTSLHKIEQHLGKTGGRYPGAKPDLNGGHAFTSKKL